MNTNLPKDNERKAQSAAMAVYSTFRLHYNIEESKQKTIESLTKSLYLTEKTAKQIVKQLWN